MDGHGIAHARLLIVYLTVHSVSGDGYRMAGLPASPESEGSSSCAVSTDSSDAQMFTLLHCRSYSLYH